MHFCVVTSTLWLAFFATAGSALAPVSGAAIAIGLKNLIPPEWCPSPSLVVCGSSSCVGRWSGFLKRVVVPVGLTCKCDSFFAANSRKATSYLLCYCTDLEHGVFAFAKYSQATDE